MGGSRDAPECLKTSKASHTKKPTNICSKTGGFPRDLASQGDTGLNKLGLGVRNVVTDPHLLLWADRAMSPGRPPAPGCMLSPSAPAHHRVPVPKTRSPGEPVAAGATSGSSGEWPRQHSAARPQRTCAKSHAGETEARGETELWTKLPDPPPVLSLPTLHGDWWQFRRHQPSLGTRAGDSPPMGTYLAGWPWGAVALQHLRAGGCTPGCWRVHPWLLAVPWRGVGAGGGAGVGPAPGPRPTRLLPGVRCALQPAPLTAMLRISGLGATPPSASARLGCRGGPGGPAAPPRAAQTRLSHLRDAQKPHRSHHPHGHSPTRPSHCIL